MENLILKIASKDTNIEKVTEAEKHLMDCVFSNALINPLEFLVKNYKKLINKDFFDCLIEHYNISGILSIDYRDIPINVLHYYLDDSILNNEFRMYLLNEIKNSQLEVLRVTGMRIRQVNDSMDDRVKRHEKILEEGELDNGYDYCIYGYKLDFLRYSTEQMMARTIINMIDIALKKPHRHYGKRYCEDEALKLYKKFNNFNDVRGIFLRPPKGWDNEETAKWCQFYNKLTYGEFFEPKVYMLGDYKKV